MFSGAIELLLRLVMVLLWADWLPATTEEEDVSEMPRKPCSGTEG